jgi:G3E family GTPase
VFRAPVDVVTGWLGSGKTTLVRRLLAAPGGARVAVLVNEIAGLDVDGRTIASLDGVDRAVELPGGCLCCEIEESRLARAVASLLDRVQPDLLVVETSGAADPGPTVARLLDAGLSLDAVIAMVDAEHGDRAIGRPVGRAQVASADFVLLNRVDLAEPASVEGLERRIVGENPRALVRRCVRAGVDPTLLFATGAAVLGRRPTADRPSGAPSAGSVGSHDVEARSLRTPLRLDPGRLRSVLEALPEGVHRAKGIARVPGSEFGLLFNAVRRRVEFEWLPMPAVESRAVAVGESMDRDWPAIRAAILDCARPAVHVEAPGVGDPVARCEAPGRGDP